MEFLKVTAQTWVSIPTILCGTTLDDLDDGGPVVCTGTLPEIYPGQATEFIGVGRVDVDEEAACAVLTDEHFWWLPLQEDSGPGPGMAAGTSLDSGVPGHV